MSGSLCVLGALASPASAQCLSGNGQLTGPGATCNTPQTLVGTNTAGTVATGWTLSTGASTAYNVSGPGDVLTNSGNITSSAATETVNISGAGAGLENQGIIQNTGSGAAVVVTNVSGGSIDNAASGNISASGTTSGYGIEATGSISGNISNEGVIGSGVDGINVAGNISGTLTNSGFITSSAGNGMAVVGNVAGVNNSGNITANGGVGIQAGLSLLNIGGGQFFFITGLNTDAGSVTGDLINSGNVSGDFGVYANIIDGNLTNTGSITGATDGVTVTGVHGNVTNGGSIVATAAGGNGFNVSPPSGSGASGGDLGGNFTNTGSISSAGRGVNIGGNLAGTFDNAGNITAQSWGVFVTDNVGGDVDNTGNVTTTTQAAIQVNGTVSGNVSLGGTLSGASGFTDNGNVNGSLTFSGGYTGAGTAIFVEGNVGGDVNNLATTPETAPAVTIMGAVGGNLTTSANMNGGIEGIFIGNGFSIEQQAGNISTIEGPSDFEILVQGNFSGQITNRGNITALNDGIFVDGDLAGPLQGQPNINPNPSIAGITNSGNITTTSSAFNESNGIASVIPITGDLINTATGGIFGQTGVDVEAIGGNFSNAGLIDSTSQAVQLTSVGGQIINSGNLTGGEFGLAFSSVVGNLTNTSTGVILTSTVLSGTVFGGPILGGSVGGNFTNAGLLSGPGIGALLTSVGGSAVNSGTISSTDALYIAGPLTGGFDNTATGVLIANGGSGFIVNGTPDNVGGSVTNEGNVTASVWGFDILGSVGGNLSNTGNITTTGNTTTGPVDAIRVGGGVRGNVTDGGTLTSATGDGIDIVGNVGGSVLFPAAGADLVSTAAGGSALAVFGNVTGNMSLTAGRTIHSASGYGILIDEGAPTASFDTVGAPGDFSGILFGLEQRPAGNVAAAVYVNGTVGGGVFVSGNVTSDTTAAIKLGEGSLSTLAAGENLTNTGFITGNGTAIDYSQATAASTLTQAGGAINGAILLSKFGDTLDITGGNITGAVFGAAAAGNSTVGTVNVNVGSGNTFTPGGQINVQQINVQSGTLRVSGGSAIGDGSAVSVFLAGTLNVASSETIGALSVANGGTILGHAGAQLTMSSLSLNPTSNLDLTLGAPSTTGLFEVNGPVTLDGTLNITDGGGFGPGVYRLIDYTGGLTDNGLDIGTTPDGVSAGNLTVQTSVADQVNLVFAGGVSAGPIEFWNGTTTSPTGAVVGGAGTWILGPNNWTDANGDTSGNWTSGMAIFEGTPGTVTVDDSAGAIQANDIQFAVSGYTVAGGNLTLNGPTPTIRVGDGSGAGAGYTATISAPILGSGGLVKTDLGTLILSGTNFYTGGTTIEGGVLSVGADANLGGAGNLTLDGGNLTVTGSFASARTVDIEAAGAITVGSGDTLNLTGNLTDTANLTKSGAGVLEVSGTGAYSGALGVSAGTLDVNGSLSAATVTVQSAATLEGAGTVGGVTIASGGHLVGVAGQILTTGPLVLSTGSNFDVSLGAPSATELVNVQGGLSLNGTLNVADAGGFGAGTYRLIDYTGDLSGSGLAIGTTPNGVSSSNLMAQTSIGDQVNLIYSTPSLGSTEFWNGTTTSPTGTVVGGAGTWILGPTNWTDAAGDASGNWTSGMAIFEGTPGAVTVDDSARAIQATDIQFAVSGYAVTGGNLTLTGSTPTIRVGDGTGAGAGYTATISAPILGTGGLIKTDLGTLVLSGTNLYTGGTTIEGGVVSVGADTNLGGSGNLTLDGGNLTVTGSFASARTVDIETAGTISIGSGDTLNLTGNLTDTAALTKAGAGVLEVSGTSAYSGALGVTAGTLEVTGSLGAATVTVASAATLEGNGTLGGPVSIANGGHLVGVEGQTLTMGALTLNPTSDFDVSLGAPGSTGLVKVNGALTLDGTLNITNAGGFGAGTYRLIDYTGGLTNDGLDIGTVPAGIFPGILTVQTSVADQVNLIYAAAGPIQFWNGTTTSPTGAVVGGSGTWKLGPTNWTDAAGDTSGNWTGGMGIFEGAPGTVTIDDSAGAIQATDLQFAVSGYTVTGGNLTLTGSTPTIRVGDGTGAGSGYTATISAPILGSNGLIKTDLGTLVLSGTNLYTGGTTVDGGVLSVGADANLGVAGNLTLDGGNLTVTGSFASARTVDIETAGTISIGSGDTLNLTGNLTDTAALTKAGAGVLEVSGTSAYSGALGVSAGTLEVTGSLGAATVTVASAATLEGNGTLGGPVNIANGGHLVGVEGQTLTMGALTLNPTSNLDVTLGAPGTTQLFQVNGALTLDGELNITNAGGFGPGTYRIIDYTGALTDNGLTIGTAPAGSLSVQTSVADQVNLVFASPGSGPLQFWNGSTTSPTGTVVGGNGTWKIGPTNWTDAAGDTSGTWATGFAIFQGAPGTVTIDNSGGAIAATGLQFAVDGYTVTGGNLTLSGSAPTIRVGDGTAAGAAYTATIAAPIAGTGGLTKTDLGTLVLSGANTYTGGTAVNGGVLQVGADANLGDASGGLALNGGTLRYGAGFASARTVSIGAAGGAIDTNGQNATLSGALGGAGGLTKLGAGKLDLTGADALAGATEVADGALAVDGSFASPTITVDSGASLGGAGLIVGNVTLASGGTFAPGDPVTTSVVGGVTFQAGSAYLAQVTPTAADLIAVTGAVTIQPGASLEVQPLGNVTSYARLSDYTIITATGGVTGTFGNVTSDLAFLTPHLTYGADVVDLSLTRNDISFASLACSANQRGVAAAAEAGGFGSPLYMALVVQTQAGACQGYNALSGELFASLPTILLEQSDQTRRTLTDRMETPSDTRGVWGEVIGSWGGFGGGSGIAGAHDSLGGGTIGVDDVFASWRLGLAGTYQQDDIDVPDRDSSASDQVLGLSLYASRAAGPVVLQLGGSYAWHRIDTSRGEIFPGFADHTTASFDAATGQAFGALGYRFDLRGGSLEPFAGLSYDQIDTADAAETGGVAALRVAGETRGVVSGRVGVRATVDFGPAADPDVSLHGSIAWRHAGDDLNGFARMAFEGTGQGFTTGGLPIAADAAEISAGLSARLGARGRLDLSYAGQLAAKWQDNAVKLRAEWAF